VSKYGKVLIRKINALIWFRHKEEVEDKRKYKDAHLSKAHLTVEFVVMTKNGGRALLCLGSMLVTVVSEA